MQSWDINPSIFRAYDVRGIYPSELDGFGAYRIGRAYINFLRNNPVLTGPLTIIVTADARISSPELKRELIKGMCDEDEYVTIIDAGLSTTPMHYFIINHVYADGGVMVTASHNPKEYNGLKLSRKEAMPIAAGLGMEEVKNTALRGIFETKGTAGRVIEKTYVKDYLDFLLKRVAGQRIKNFRVVFDLGNGMTGLLAPQLLKSLPIEAAMLYADIDMTFPHHEANPIKDETLMDLRREVKKHKADFGVAFDGDGDRISFMTHSGKRIPGDHLFGMLAEYKLQTEPGAKVVYDLRIGKAVRDRINELGGVGVESRVGRSFIKDAMRKDDAVLGGELSGHYFFKDFFYSDSALVTLLDMLLLLSGSEKTLEELDEPFCRYASSGEININIIDKDHVLDVVAAEYKDANRVSYLDGISIEYSDFWFNVRVSNTEPVVRLIMEAVDGKTLRARLEDLRELLRPMEINSTATA